jgi:hypothetical protein
MSARLVGSMIVTGPRDLLALSCSLTSATIQGLGISFSGGAPEAVHLCLVLAISGAVLALGT